VRIVLIDDGRPDPGPGRIGQQRGERNVSGMVLIAHDKCRIGPVQ